MNTFRPVEFAGVTVPPYAVLSHTWDQDDHEVSYQDLIAGNGPNKFGWRRLAFCARQAKRDGLRYFWVDSCCIDKRSSAESSEAVTSMFRWYYRSAQCFVYLSGVSSKTPETASVALKAVLEIQILGIKWFTQGWALQELLAPRIVKFFTSEGAYIGDKLYLGQQIHEVTCIPIAALHGTPMIEFEVKERMSGISNCQTRRLEDMAYSLLGIFGVHIVSLFGEGRDSALKRLERAIAEFAPDKALDVHEKKVFEASLRFKAIATRHLTVGIVHAETCE